MRYLDFRLKLFFALLGVFLLVFFSARLILFVAYREVFSALSSAQIGTAFLRGLIFDLATVATFAGAPLLMIALPFRGRLWTKAWTAVLVAELFLMVPVLAGDIVFFEHVKRHVGDEIKLLTNDFGFIVGFAFKDYLLHLLAALTVLSALLVFSLRAIDSRHSKAPPRASFGPHTSPFYKRFFAGAVRALCVAAFLILSIRGWTLHGKPINVIDAFDFGSSEYGNLVLNGVFTAYQAARSSVTKNHAFFGGGEAIKTARELIVESDERVVDEKFPLMRVKTDFSTNGAGFNVVFVMFEAWGFNFIDAFSGGGHGVTPNFDAVSKNGLMFTNFYASGQRSIQGIAASLVGMPALPGTPYLGKGLELADITRAGRLLGENGYSTVFVQTSKRRSYRMEGISSALGFGEFYGKSDIPLRYPYKTSEAPDFGYDYDGLMFLKDKIDGLKKPFFAFIFLGTTHAPYILLDDRFEKYPHDRKSLDGYLNTLYYSDYSLGEFLGASRKSKWFDNTIFIFTSDHAPGQFDENTLNDKFRIPLTIYCPKLFRPGKIDSLGSQADLLPTIIDALNINAPYTALGKSLLRAYGERLALFIEGDNVGLITGEGYLKHSLKRRLEVGSFKAGYDPDRAEKILLSLDEALYTLLRENRWHNSARR